MKVLVTRLEADSNKTAAKLVQAGFDPVVLPLTTLNIIADIPNFSQPDFSIFTSANGVYALSEKIAEPLKLSPAYAVGPRTADALRKKAYKNIRIGDGSAAELANLVIKDQGGKSACGVYVCGEDRSYDFTRAFVGKVGLELYEVYKIASLNVPVNEIKLAFAEAQGGAALVYSPAGAKRLLEVMVMANMRESMNTITIVAISDNAAKPIRQFTNARIVVSCEPNEDSMLDVLAQIQQ